jgi:hypothetical protein
VATCTLRIGDRVALASVGGAPEVEYALFDPGAIELAATGPGMVQEVGYVTTVGEAIGRLKDGGVEWPFVLETAGALQPSVAIAYARGPAVRRIATSLGPAELFDGFRYDATTKAYEGRWLDLPALARDADVPRLTQTLQTMHLLALLSEVSPDDPVQLVTRDHMAEGRPGGRSYKRYAFTSPEGLPATFRALGERIRATPPNAREEREAGPTPAELLEMLRDRIVLLADAAQQDRLRAIERAIGIRQRPMRGPLADPELWAIEEQLSAGRTEGVLELVDALEKSKGKQPATAYLRIRAALLGGREPPRAIAEKIASLALSIPSFVELELLAAEAWNAAGDPKRALPFARDLISNSSVNDELRVRESQQLAATLPSEIKEEAPTSKAVQQREPEIELEVEPFEVEPPQRVTQPINLDDDRKSAPPSLRSRLSTPPVPPSIRPPTAASRKETPPMVFGTIDPATGAPSVPVVRAQGLLPKRTISGTWVGPPPSKGPPGATRPTEMRFGAVPPPPASERNTPTTSRTPIPPTMSRTPIPPPTSRTSVPPPTSPTPVPPKPSARPMSRPSPDVARVANVSSTELMRGASQPPFRSDSPEAHVNVPKAAPVPHFDEGAEAAAALTLPEGLRGVPNPIEMLPRTVLDARLQFTFLARELGREYDEQLGVVLRADISGVEAMQRVLLERYGNRAVTTPEAAADVRRHGAFLSEILARTFGGFWVDIGPNDVGYWAMVVPPGTRVWPFGRVLRLIAMQHNERDLVSYFLELQGRAARG